MTDNVELLRQMDARGADLNAQYPERFYWTPLMTAIYFDSTNVIRHLVNRGVDLTKRSRVAGGETALMMAIGSNDTNTVTLLFQKAPRVLSQTEDWPVVRSLTRAAGGDVRALVDEFLKTNPPASSKP